jgi:hypothetical protein
MRLYANMDHMHPIDPQSGALLQAENKSLALTASEPGSIQ